MQNNPQKSNPRKVIDSTLGLTYYEKLAPKGKLEVPKITYSEYNRMSQKDRKAIDLALSQSELLMDLLMHSVTKRLAPNSTPQIIPLENSSHLAIASVEIPNAKTLNPENWRSKGRNELVSSTDSDKENHDYSKAKRPTKNKDLENTSELCDVIRKFVSDADDNDENKMKDLRGRFFTIDLGRAFQYDYGSAKNFATELPQLYLDTFEDNDIQDFSKKHYQAAIDHVVTIDVKSTVEEIEKNASAFLKANNMDMSDFLFNFKGELKRFSTPKDLAYSIGLELIESKKRLDTYNQGLKSIKDVDRIIDNADSMVLEEIDEAPDFMVAASIKSEMFKKLKPLLSKTDQILEENFREHLSKGLDKSR